jgi:predicted HicB family RNase H-like nuclease
MMRYKGYVGVVEIDPDAEVIHGRVIGLRDVITFEGSSVPEARQAFHGSVDDYLEWCKSEGRAPEKPFSGKLLLRLEPALHRSLAQLAEARRTSINRLAIDALAGMIATSEPKTSKRSK